MEQITVWLGKELNYNLRLETSVTPPLIEEEEEQSKVEEEVGVENTVYLQ